MKISAFVIAATAAALVLPVPAALGADSGARTSMPSSCSDRDANCVIQDGPPRNRRGQLVETAPPPAPDGKGGKTGASGNTNPRDTGSQSPR